MCNSIKLILIKHSTKGLIHTTEEKKKAKHNGTLLAYVTTGIVHLKKKLNVFAEALHLSVKMTIWFSEDTE